MTKSTRYAIIDKLRDQFDTAPANHQFLGRPQGRNACCTFCGYGYWDDKHWLSFDTRYGMRFGNHKPKYPPAL